MATATENRKRKRRTFTMDDESYERLTHMADSAHTNRSRFLEQLILLAEPIFS
jgi:predicted transcriptional regulator